ncbi:hypothetical protein FE257_011724 [Aspergillus nanangensis]|uniref:Uncharacterized protein n=1 Tax=Aspergillus nanangensis TaxID=2582783 RepID=A0AAD4GWZ6_ASPNN|nr:hypothetical protein FE257_011724 [Aspergillus nanangensis]
MSHGRVIQDSDDEDDPLTAAFLPPANPPHSPQVYDQPNPQHGPEGPGTNNGPIGVNFDQFLQSQEAVQARLSSSQQRREERWIPTTAEGAGSISSMMTEIGLAQRRLFDEEEDHYPNQYTSRPPHFDESPHMTEYAPQHINGIPQMANGEYGASKLPNQYPGESYPPTLPYTNQPDDQYTHNIQICPPHPDAHLDQHASLSSHDGSNQTASYNLFESSLRPSANSYSENLNTTTILISNGLPNTDEIQKGNCRSNSQGPLSSPHDTEPNSSVLRARSDNAGLVELAQPTATGTVDEHAAPALSAIEVPQIPVEKKRGRKKKESVPRDEDEDDELAAPATSRKIVTNTIIQPEKRKPGRPPKNAKKFDDTNQPETNGPSYTPVNPQDDIPTNDPDTINVSSTEGQRKEREPRKKKLKRGKTTSAILHKTYTSDVEDDVIWVDERPVNPDSGEQYKLAELAPPGDNHLEPDAAEAKENALSEQSKVTPAPKKRGRKRKKTAEQLPPADEAAATPVQETEPPVLPPIEDTNDQPFDPENNVDNNTKIQDLKAPDSKTDPNTPNPPQPPSTPPKPAPQTPSTSKGPTKHSPISTTGKVPYRIGLSRRARIAPLLKIVKR